MLTVDIIVRTRLLKDRRPIHFYIEYLVHAVACLRELGFDVLKNTNTDILKVDPKTKSVKLPCSVMDIVAVGTPSGQYVKPLLQYDKISNLSKFDGAGNRTLYNTDLLAPIDPVALNVNWFLTPIDSHGANTGRIYGFGQGRERDTYKWIKDRQEIQLDEHCDAKEIVLEWITDGTDCDAATKVEPYAQMTIESFIVWQYKECNRNYGIGERQIAEQAFERYKSGLVSRLNPLTIEDVKRISRRGYYAANKE